MYFNVFVYGLEVEGGRKLREIIVDCLSFFIEVEDRVLECGELLVELFILIYLFRNQKGRVVQCGIIMFYIEGQKQ